MRNYYKKCSILHYISNEVEDNEKTDMDKLKIAIIN